MIREFGFSQMLLTPICPCQNNDPFILVNKIKNQEDHHQARTFSNEYVLLVKTFQVGKIDLIIWLKPQEQT
jgi:hypothetical protein